MRSFVTRQKVKRREKAIFDDFVRQKGVIQFEDLEFLLKRLIFFYYSKDVKDGERLVSTLVVSL
jgi:ubiquitin-protein ligase E3 C